jgi:hypothetical protein
MMRQPTADECRSMLASLEGAGQLQAKLLVRLASMAADLDSFIGDAIRFRGRLRQERAEIAEQQEAINETIVTLHHRLSENGDND